MDKAQQPTQYSAWYCCEIEIACHAVRESRIPTSNYDPSLDPYHIQAALYKLVLIPLVLPSAWFASALLPSCSIEMCMCTGAPPAGIPRQIFHVADGELGRDLSKLHRFRSPGELFKCSNKPCHQIRHFPSSLSRSISSVIADGGRCRSCT